MRDRPSLSPSYAGLIGLAVATAGVGGASDAALAGRDASSVAPLLLVAAESGDAPAASPPPAPPGAPSHGQASRSASGQASAPIVLGPARTREIVDAHGTKGLEAAFLVAGEPDALLAMLWDVRRFRTIFPDVKRVEVLSDRGDVIDARFTVEVVFREAHYVLRREVDRDARTIRWRGLSGDAKRIEGAWRIESSDVPGHSRLTYTSFLDLGFFVPTALLRDIALSKVDAMVGRVRSAAAKPAPSDVTGG